MDHDRNFGSPSVTRQGFRLGFTFTLTFPFSLNPFKFFLLDNGKQPAAPNDFPGLLSACVPQDASKAVHFVFLGSTQALPPFA
jgi:hypothetical protein